MTFRLTRRHALLAAAATTGAAFAPPVFARTAAAGACVLTPETTAGPYYLARELVRGDIREDRAGVPLRLALNVVDAACRPIPGARLDVWHCDAAGVYSAFGGGDAGQRSAKGETFLRGVQMTDAAGAAEFTTIYPGWYPGRTTHIHFMVYLDRTRVLTGQLFFPDALSDEIYGDDPAYRRGRRRTRLNGNDWIAQRAGRTSRLDVGRGANGYVGRMTIGVDPSAA